MIIYKSAPFGQIAPPLSKCFRGLCAQTDHAYVLLVRNTCFRSEKVRFVLDTKSIEVISSYFSIFSIDREGGLLSFLDCFLSLKIVFIPHFVWKREGSVTCVRGLYCVIRTSRQPISEGPIYVTNPGLRTGKNLFLCNSIPRNGATSQGLFHYDVRRIGIIMRIRVVVLRKVRIWLMVRVIVGFFLKTLVSCISVLTSMEVSFMLEHF